MPNSAATATESPRTKADIARENGAKSRGPVTARGKLRSAQNAITHSLSTSHLARLTAEDQERFNALQQSYVGVWRPENIVEQDLVEEMAVAKWQERRCMAIENALFDFQARKQKAEALPGPENLDDITRHALAFMQLADESRALPLLLRYGAEHNRRYHRAMRQLIALRGKGVLKDMGKRNEPSETANQNKTQQQKPAAAVVEMTGQPVCPTPATENVPAAAAGAASERFLYQTA